MDSHEITADGRNFVLVDQKLFSRPKDNLVDQNQFICLPQSFLPIYNENHYGHEFEEVILLLVLLGNRCDNVFFFQTK
jgi:hypothetical protein